MNANSWSSTRFLEALGMEGGPGLSRRTTVTGLLVAVAVGVPAFGLFTALDTSRGMLVSGPHAVGDTIQATGRLDPMASVTVGSSISGAIDEVFCDENVRVRKGQICARIDPRPYQAEVDQDRASLATAKAQLEKDEASLAYATGLARRYAALVQQRAVSQDQLDNVAASAAQARAQVDLDKASVAQHAATLEAAEIYLEYTNIKSPIDGVVVSRHAVVGETIAAQFQSPTLFVIASDLAKMQLSVPIGERYVDLVHVGDRVTYSLDALPDRQFGGTVLQIRLAPQREGNQVSYMVSIRADNREGLFRPGMVARATIYVSNRTASAGTLR